MSLMTLLGSRMGRETVVVGIGNPYRGDDVAGTLVAHLLRELVEVNPDGRCPDGRHPRRGLRIVEAQEVPEAYLGPIISPRPDTVILVDAMALGQPPGTVALLEMEELAEREASTHRAPLSLLARYVQAETGADVFALGIQPGSRTVGVRTSPEIRGATSALAEILACAAATGNREDDDAGGDAPPRDSDASSAQADSSLAKWQTRTCWPVPRSSPC